MLTDAQVYCMMSMIYLFQPPLIAKAIGKWRKQSCTLNTLRRSGITKYRAWPWSREYSIWPSTWKHGRELLMIFCAWDRNEPIFRPQSQCDAEIPSVFAFQASVHKQTPFNISRLQFVRHPISLLLNHSHGFETFWNGLLSHSYDRANSSWFGHESCSSNASNSASSETFSLAPLCRSSTSKSPFLKRWNHSRHVLSLIAVSL